MNEKTQGACEGVKGNSTCTSVASQYADVNVPLKLKPYAIVGTVVTECCGDPVVTLRSCQGMGCSCGCELVITQTVCIRIPVAYGAEADVGEVASVCKRHPNCVIAGTNADY